MPSNQFHKQRPKEFCLSCLPFSPLFHSTIFLQFTLKIGDFKEGKSVEPVTKKLPTILKAGLGISVDISNLANLRIKPSYQASSGKDLWHILDLPCLNYYRWRISTSMWIMIWIIIWIMITMHWQKDQQTTQDHDIVEFTLKMKSFYLPQAHIRQTHTLFWNGYFCPTMIFYVSKVHLFFK